MTRTLRSLAAGSAGAGVLTLIHQAARSLTPHAPRMDVLGMRAVRTAHHRFGTQPPDDAALERQALAGDLVANSAFYALVGAGDRRTTWARGIALGLAAGVGAILLPRHVGLGDAPNAGRLDTQVMTIAWYVVGGLVAAAAFAAADDGERAVPARVRA